MFFSNESLSLLITHDQQVHKELLSTGTTIDCLLCLTYIRMDACFCTSRAWTCRIRSTVVRKRSGRWVGVSLLVAFRWRLLEFDRRWKTSKVLGMGTSWTESVCFLFSCKGPDYCIRIDSVGESKDRGNMIMVLTRFMFQQILVFIDTALLGRGWSTGDVRLFYIFHTFPEIVRVYCIRIDSWIIVMLLTHDVRMRTSRHRLWIYIYITFRLYDRLMWLTLHAVLQRYGIHSQLGGITDTKGGFAVGYRSVPPHPGILFILVALKFSTK